QGLDGKPRPINLNHGFANIQWDSTTSWVKKNLINRIHQLGEGDGWREEHTVVVDAQRSRLSFDASLAKWPASPCPQRAILSRFLTGCHWPDGQASKVCAGWCKPCLS